jgi:Transcriptional regulators
LAVSRHDLGEHLYSVFYEYNCLLRELSSEAGLYCGQPRILAAIKDNEGCTLSELSELIGIGMPSLSVSIKNMKKSGLIKSERYQTPAKGIFLTDDGLTKILGYQRLIDKAHEGLLDKLGSEHAEEAGASLKLICDYLESYRKKK